VAQNPGRVADAYGACDMPSGIGIGGAYVPYNSVARDSLSDIVVVNNDGGCGHRGGAPQKQQRNEGQAVHDKLLSWAEGEISESVTSSEVDIPPIFSALSALDHKIFSY